MKWKRIVVLIQSALILLITVTTPTLMAEQSVRPGVNKSYQNPAYLQWRRRFERPGREVYDKRVKIVQLVGLKPGMVVADIGAGTGLFTKLFSIGVGSAGKVYAVDISRNFIKSIEANSKISGLNNVIAMVNTATTTGLKKNSIDIVFISATYHHFEYPNSMMDSVYQALKASGRLIVIDFRKQQGVSSNWVINHVRADKNTVIREISSRGFKLVADSKLLKTNYFLKFVKK